MTRDRIQNWLEQAGHNTHVDDDGDLIFTIDGRTYCIEHKEEDPYFYRIIFPNFWEIEDEEERAWVERACNEATARIKVAKVFPVTDNTWGSVELFCDDAASFLRVLERSLGALQAAVGAFVEGMRARKGKGIGEDEEFELPDFLDPSDFLQPNDATQLGEASGNKGKGRKSSEDDDDPDNDILDILKKRG